MIQFETEFLARWHAIAPLVPANCDLKTHLAERRSMDEVLAERRSIIEALSPHAVPS